MPSPFYNAPEWIVTIRSDGATLAHPIAELRLAVHGAEMKALAIPSPKSAEARLAEPRRFFQHCVEHRHEVAG
jgi:hypothetical protein